MEWLLEPSLWAGLATLIAFEVVLGLESLAFVASLTERLPPRQHKRARLIGLSLALLLRLALLALIVWAIRLEQPLFPVGEHWATSRHFLLMLGGIFLVAKSVLDLAVRLETESPSLPPLRTHGGLGVVIAQIVILEAAFSFDTIFVAIGLTDSLAVMVVAMVVAFFVQQLGASPLLQWLQAHPIVITLAQALLLVVGFALMAEGLGLWVPTPLIYAITALAALVALAQHRWPMPTAVHESRHRLRARTAESILSLLGKPADDDPQPSSERVPESTDTGFEVEERNMVSGVLNLVERSVHSIMTPRGDISWIDLHDDPQQIQERLLETPHNFFPVCRGQLDEVVGLGRARDLLADILTTGKIQTESLREPLIVHESIRMLSLMDTLKRSRGQVVLVTDEFGAIEGLVTPIDVFEAIAGEFPDEDEQPDILAESDESWRVAGAADLLHLEQELGISGLVNDDYATLGGFLLSHFDQLPEAGQVFESSAHGLRFEVLEVKDRRIGDVRITRLTDSHPQDPEATSP